ncbi:probable adenylate kinase 7, mitochondrial [Rutidosis leptorrhynchoides]|uniref:probable adenylate kinase 7, mitochondrial n=1 Tax=Rutidosis leptorrhynchoides TaxID=125765 RepID=UPI003A99468E
MALTAGIRRLRSTGAAHLSRCRSYGSAAAAVDYEYYDYSSEEEENQLHVLGSRAEPGTTAPEKGVKWVLIGEPRTKKHVYAENLSKILEVPYISMGSLVRQELNPKSSLYKEIAKSVNEGNLVTENIMFALLSKRLEEGLYRGENGFILDGIPRTRLQAEILDQITDVDLVVNFKCSGKESLSNNSLGAEFLDTSNSRFRTEAGSALKEKFGRYTEQSKELEEYYRRQKKILDFQVTGAPGETWQRLLTALFLQSRNSIVSPA